MMRGHLEAGEQPRSRRTRLGAKALDLGAHGLRQRRTGLLEPLGLVGVGLVDVQRVPLATADGETVVLWWADPAPDRPVILYFHGNAGSIAQRADRLAFYQSRGYGAAFLSWRGYGGSTGHPTEAGLMQDAEAAYAYLLAQGVAPDRIVLLGESLGSGVAVQLAARHKVAAVILEAPYTAAVDLSLIHI